MAAQWSHGGGRGSGGGYGGGGGGGFGGGYHRDRGEWGDEERRQRAQAPRRCVDISGSIMQQLIYRPFIPTAGGDPPAGAGGSPWSIQPHSTYVRRMLPPAAIRSNPASGVCTQWVKTSTNKQRCPVFCLAWAPEGVTRCITGNSSGEFTLWKDGPFNFVTILQAHESAVRSMAWSHSGNTLISGDHIGIIKYWQPSMTPIRQFVSHGANPVRGLSFGPTDSKFASCSDDSTVRIWDWEYYKEERALTGHGWDVKTVEWHPYKSLIVSGSKDNLIKLWDPRTGNSLSTLYGHKNTVSKVTWNKNGNWLVSCSRDQTIKLYDIRTMKDMCTFKGHGQDVTALAWHPHHERLLVSGGYDGKLIYWIVGSDKPYAEIEYAHEGTAVWDLGWHPVGHVLASGSNDHTVKFWVRNRTGDPMGCQTELNEDGTPAEVDPNDNTRPEGFTTNMPMIMANNFNNQQYGNSHHNVSMNNPSHPAHLNATKPPTPPEKKKPPAPPVKVPPVLPGLGKPLAVSLKTRPLSTSFKQAVARLGGPEPVFPEPDKRRHSSVGSKENTDSRGKDGGIRGGKGSGSRAASSGARDASGGRGVGGARDGGGTGSRPDRGSGGDSSIRDGRHGGRGDGGERGNRGEGWGGADHVPPEGYRCHNCGNTGHKKDFCPFPRLTSSQRRNPTRAGSGRGTMGASSAAQTPPPPPNFAAPGVIVGPMLGGPGLPPPPPPPPLMPQMMHPYDGGGRGGLPVFGSGVVPPPPPPPPQQQQQQGPSRARVKKRQKKLQQQSERRSGSGKRSRKSY